MKNDGGSRTATLIDDSPFEELGQGRDFTLLEIVTTLALRKRFIAKVTLGATLVGCLGAVLMPYRYTAVTKILPPQQSQSSAVALLNSLGNNPIGALAATAGKDLGIKNPAELYLGILKTRPIADALIHRFNLQKVYRARDMTGARHDLAAHTDMVVQKEGLISVSVQDRDKKLAADLANGYIAEVRELTKGLAFTEASQRRLFYEEQLKAAKDELIDAEAGFKQSQEKNGILQVDAQAKVLIEGVGALRAHLVAKQVELEALRSYATDQNPEVAIIQRELAGLQSELHRLEKQGSGSDIYELSLKNAPEAGLAYLRALREVKYREALFELLTKQYAAARLDEARDAPLVQIVELAIEPERCSFPHPALLVPLFSGLGFLVACLLITITMAVARARADPRQAENLRALRAAIFGR
ncbi:MAG TPA: Wzz/FepE/Etk N-terminal domain-containing protein [Candidatus Saccharimonadales bacterium]|jgi:tyrosine-protein kinase Etk/Wzc|nr:Wzz/FepE/Etk N-terminal domain-containing protein [Candidatus Saccharimonadales bacterium]